MSVAPPGDRELNPGGVRGYERHPRTCTSGGAPTARVRTSLMLMLCWTERCFSPEYYKLTSCCASMERYSTRTRCIPVQRHAPQAVLALRTQNHPRVMLLVERVSQRFLLSALPSAPSVQTTLPSREVNARRGPLLPDSNSSTVFLFLDLESESESDCESMWINWNDQ